MALTQPDRGPVVDGHVPPSVVQPGAVRLVVVKVKPAPQPGVLVHLVRQLPLDHPPLGPRGAQHQGPQPRRPQVAACQEALGEYQVGGALGEDDGGCLFVGKGDVAGGAAEAPGGYAQAAAWGVEERGKRDGS